MAARDPFLPVALDSDRPNSSTRVRSSIGLILVLLVLGVLAALAVGLAIVLLWAAFTAALG